MAPTMRSRWLALVLPDGGPALGPADVAKAGDLGMTN